MPKASPVGSFWPFFSRPPFQTLSQMAHHVCSNPSLVFPLYEKQVFVFVFFRFCFCFCFCFFVFLIWGWFFCCEIFSHQTEIGDSKAGAELLDIILTKVHISLCVCGILLISISSYVCSICGLFYCFWKIYARLEHWAENIVIFPIPKVVYFNQFL